MRNILAALIICASVLPAAWPALADSHPQPEATHQAKVGDVVLLKLPGDPKAGFRWQLSPANSRGLDLVKVDQVGWVIAEEGKSFFFKRESLLTVAVHAKAPGMADITFEYWRATANPLRVRSTTTRVVITP